MVLLEYMNLTEIAIGGAMILFSLLMVIVAGQRIIEMWASSTSIGGSIMGTVLWLFLGGGFLTYLAEVRQNIKDGC